MADVAPLSPPDAPTRDAGAATGGALVPYDQSGRWRTHDAYFAARGVGAWLDGEIPHRSTNNRTFARQQAALLLELTRALVADGHLGASERVEVLEIGGGLGDFAAGLLDALDHDLGAPGRALLDRLTYVFSDVSSTSLRQALERPALAAHVASGRVSPALFDARDPGSLRALAGDPMRVAPVLVVASYVCCVLPTKVIRKGSAWFELHAGPAPVAAVPGSAPPAGSDGGPSRRWEDFVGPHAWRPVDLAAFGALDRGAIEHVLAASPAAELSYPRAFAGLVDAVQAWARPGALFVVTEFVDPSCDERVGTESRIPVLYGDSLNHPVCFPLLEALVAARGGASLAGRPGHCPTRTALISLGAPFPEAVRGVFEAGFVHQNKGQDRLDFEAMARKLRGTGDHAEALRFYDRCIALDPHDPALFEQAGDTCLEAGKPALALGYYRLGAQADRWGAHDFERRLGAAHLGLDGPEQAIPHFEASLRAAEAPATWIVLGDAHQARGAYGLAYRAYLRALALEPGLADAVARIDAMKPAWCDAELGIRETVERWWASKQEEHGAGAMS